MISIIIVIKYIDSFNLLNKKLLFGKTRKDNVFISEAIPKEKSLLRITVREKKS